MERNLTVKWNASKEDNIMKRVARLVLVLIFFLCFGGLAHADLVSTFDSSAEGWTTEGATDVTHHSTGGNPGGFIEAADTTGTYWRFVSPNSWQGDWSGYAGGKVSYDIVPLNQSANQNGNNIEIWSGENYMYWGVTTNPKKGVWTTFTVTLTDANFTEVGDTFNNILNNVTALKIWGDIVYGTGLPDHTGLDNVRVNAIPIPGAVWLLGSGLLGLAGWRRFKKS
jgi:hypothetical protein